VCGLAHCQSQLTDGFIADEVLPMIGIAGTARARRLADELVTAGLFDKVDGGYAVHDYLDFNQSKAQVLAKRAEETQRKRAGIRTESARNPDGIRSESGPPRARIPSHPIPSVKKLASPVERPKAPSDPRVKEFLAWFQAEYRRRRGGDYLVDWAKDGALVKAMLGATELQTLQECAAILLESDEPWISETDRGIGVLKARFNWLSDRRAQWLKTNRA
jgi:hypothetical protein